MKRWMIGIGGAVGIVFMAFTAAFVVCYSLTDVSIETYKRLCSVYNEDKGLVRSRPQSFKISEMGGVIVVRWDIEDHLTPLVYVDMLGVPEGCIWTTCGNPDFFDEWYDGEGPFF